MRLLRLLLIPTVRRLLLLLLITRNTAVILLLRRRTSVTRRHRRIHVIALRTTMRRLMRALRASLLFGLHLRGKTSVIVDLMR